MKWVWFQKNSGHILCRGYLGVYQVEACIPTMLESKTDRQNKLMLWTRHSVYICPLWLVYIWRRPSLKNFYIQYLNVFYETFLEWETFYFSCESCDCGKVFQWRCGISGVVNQSVFTNKLNVMKLSEASAAKEMCDVVCVEDGFASIACTRSVTYTDLQQ